MIRLTTSITTGNTHRPRIWTALGLGTALLLQAVFTSALLGAPAEAQTIRARAGLPPNPSPGECYARVYIPAKTREVAKRVLLAEPAEQIVVTPAEYRWVEKKIEIEGESERIEVTPARYEMQKRTIVIEPERREVSVQSPVYETVSEPVLVRQSYTTWKPGDGPIQKIDSATGEIMCLVTVPAEFKSVERRVVKQPARLVTKIVPAKTMEITVKVMVERPRRRVIRTPAVTKTIKVLEQVRTMSTERKRVPAQYQTVLETVKADEGRMEWRPILCATNAKPGLIRKIQVALKRRGFNPGGVDGQLGPKTYKAIARFQRSRGLAEGGVLIETLKALGVNPEA